MTQQAVQEVLGEVRAQHLGEPDRIRNDKTTIRERVARGHRKAHRKNGDGEK